MRYGYTIVYVDRVPETLEFYRDAFDFEIKFIHESQDYGELATGETVLAFATHELGETNLGGRYLRGNMEAQPFGLELAFITKDVAAAYARAVKKGALPVQSPVVKPWGQTVGYVRAIDGSIVELCSPMNG